MIGINVYKDINAVDSILVDENRIGKLSINTKFTNNKECTINTLFDNVVITDVDYTNPTHYEYTAYSYLFDSVPKNSKIPDYNIIFCIHTVPKYIPCGQYKKWINKKCSELIKNNTRTFCAVPYSEFIPNIPPVNIDTFIENECRYITLTIEKAIYYSWSLELDPIRSSV